MNCAIYTRYGICHMYTGAHRVSIKSSSTRSGICDREQSINRTRLITLATQTIQIESVGAQQVIQLPVRYAPLRLSISLYLHSISFIDLPTHQHPLPTHHTPIARPSKPPMNTHQHPPCPDSHQSDNIPLDSQ